MPVNAYFSSLPKTDFVPCMEKYYANMRRFDKDYFLPSSTTSMPMFRAVPQMIR